MLSLTNKLMRGIVMWGITYQYRGPKPAQNKEAATSSGSVTWSRQVQRLQLGILDLLSISLGLKPIRDIVRDIRSFVIFRFHLLGAKPHLQIERSRIIWRQSTKKSLFPVSFSISQSSSSASGCHHGTGTLELPAYTPCTPQQSFSTRWYLYFGCTKIL